MCAQIKGARTQQQAPPAVDFCPAESLRIMHS
jgi:hypothetical protein